MSYLHRKPEDEVWYIHSPLKKGGRELVTAPPPSQIPYLNGVFDDEATMNEPKPIYVRETDSEYIRRCKVGGSHDLLVHIDPATKKSKEPVAYPRPLWWDAMCEQYPEPNNSSGNAVNEEKKEHVFGAPAWFVHGQHKPSANPHMTPPLRQEPVTTTIRTSPPAKQTPVGTKTKRK